MPHRLSHRIGDSVTATPLRFDAKCRWLRAQDRRNVFIAATVLDWLMLYKLLNVVR